MRTLPQGQDNRTQARSTEIELPRPATAPIVEIFEVLADGSVRGRTGHTGNRRVPGGQVVVRTRDELREPERRLKMEWLRRVAQGDEAVRSGANR